MSAKSLEIIAFIYSFFQNEINVLADHYGNQKTDTFQGHRTIADPMYSEAEYKAQFLMFKPQLCLMK